jgi:hypothetical protein
MQQDPTARFSKTVCIEDSLRDRDTATCAGWTTVGRAKVFQNAPKPIKRAKAAPVR